MLACLGKGRQNESLPSKALILREINMFIPENIHNYCVNNSSTPSTFLEEIFKLTHESQDLPQMLVGKMEASVLGLLIRITNSKNILEIGTFTGYSALAMAESLPESGNVTTLDINKIPIEQIAIPVWNKSPHGKKIQSIIGPALDSLSKLNDKFDLVFIDADKSNYLNYVQQSLPKLSENGIIVVDNTLWDGKVIDYNETDISTQTIRQLNEWVAKQDNLYSTLLPVRDGMLVIKPI